MMHRVNFHFVGVFISLAPAESEHSASFCQHVLDFQSPRGKSRTSGTSGISSAGVSRFSELLFPPLVGVVLLLWKFGGLVGQPKKLIRVHNRQ